MTIYHPYEVSVGSDILVYSFELPEALVAVFTEGDRVPSPPEEDQDDDHPAEYRYEATVRTIRHRLEVMGYTAPRWREELESFRQEALEGIEREIEDTQDDEAIYRRLRRTAAVIEHSPPERWIETLIAMISDGWGWSSREGRSYVLAKTMTDGEYGPIQMPFTDERCLLRAMVDQCDDTEVVEFNFATAIWDQHVEPETRFTEQATARLREGAQAVEKIIVLTEGKTDTRMLARSFERLYPHLIHMFSFFDHQAFRTGGGAGELERLARGFAGAGISNRTIVLFDNDTAGHSAAKRLAQAGLPDNFQIITLPELEFAKAYPTIGPTGAAMADVNGSACGIELYCGPTALTGNDGALVPIQWTGYDQAMKRYQGEPIEKDKIQDRFFEILDGSSDPSNDPELASIKQVLRSILNVVW